VCQLYLTGTRTAFCFCCEGSHVCASISSVATTSSCVGYWRCIM